MTDLLISPCLRLAFGKSQANAQRKHMEMAVILEGIVTTISPDGQIHIAPMGPRVDAAMERFLLRPFPTSQTYRNLVKHGEGVVHVTDDVFLLARAALGAVEPAPTYSPAGKIKGFVLHDACRYYEFRVRSIDDRAGCAISSASTGPSMPWSRRPSWPPGRLSCP